MRLRPLHLLIACAASVALLAAAAESARACMPGAMHPQMDAFVFWHDGVQVTVWRSMVARPVDGMYAAATPRRRSRAVPLAWLLAVPSAPLAYAVTETRDFENASRWANGYVDYSALNAEGFGGSGGRGGHDGLSIGATVSVGEYRVTPITGTGAAAVTALKRWLRRNGFHVPRDERGLRYYAERNATFLAVKAALPAGGDAGELRPLAIAFASDRITLPIHLSVGEPAYALSATILSSRRPVLAGPLAHGLVAQDLVGPGPARAADQDGVIVMPHVNLASATRNLIRPVLRGMPQLARLEHGALYFARLAAAPLVVEAGRDDPAIALGDAIDVNATAPPPATTPNPAPRR